MNETIENTRLEWGKWVIRNTSKTVNWKKELKTKCGKKKEVCKVWESTWLNVSDDVVVKICGWWWKGERHEMREKQWRETGETIESTRLEWGKWIVTDSPDTMNRNMNEINWWWKDNQDSSNLKTHQIQDNSACSQKEMGGNENEKKNEWICKGGKWAWTDCWKHQMECLSVGCYSN